ncbi:glycolipid 2-alpha-mannosyltransferase [Botrytis cinerea]
MATGTARYLRYILFAFFGLAIVYFISSSSDQRLQTAQQVFTDKTGIPTKAGTSPGHSAEDSTTSDAKTSPNTHDLPPATIPGERMNATFVTLARNSDIWEIARSIRQVEDRFNKKFHYDWVFLNDKPFDATFKKVTASLVSGKTHYGEIPEKHWSFPDHIDTDRARKVREDMAQRKIIYGDSVSYRHMCRFESGFFFQQELMLNYEWYWRVEPSIELFCDIDYDAFKFMADNKKKYSFVLSLYEYVETIPTLWDSVKKFIKAIQNTLPKATQWVFSVMMVVKPTTTATWYVLWSNFEIGNLNWLRSKAYTDYFEQLDQDGGFFYERLLLKKEEIHFFNDIAYYHVPFTHCPTGEQTRLDLKCHCNPKDNFDWKGYSCTSRFFDINKMEKPEGYENQQD